MSFERKKNFCFESLQFWQIEVTLSFQVFVVITDSILFKLCLSENILRWGGKHFQVIAPYNLENEMTLSSRMPF